MDALSFSISALYDARGVGAAATDVRQFGQAVQEVDKAGSAAAGSGGGLGQLSQTFALGLGAGVATFALGQVTDAASRAGDTLRDLARDGINFNTAVESGTLSIAAILRQFNPEQFSSVTSAFGRSGEVIEQLKTKALETTASFTDLLQAFTATAGVATAAGIPIGKQADLVVLLSNAAAGLGVEQRQLGQETRALLTGQIDENAAIARAVGITREQIETQRAQGKLYEFLTGKLGSFGEAGKLAANTFAGLQSNFGDITTQLSGEVTAGAFEALKDGLVTLNAALSDPATRASARELGTEIGVVAKAVVGLGAAAVQNAGTIKALFAATGVGQAVTGARVLLSTVTATTREQNELTKAGQDHAASLRATVASATTAENRDRARVLLNRELANLEAQISDAQGETTRNGERVKYETAESIILGGTRGEVQKIADDFGKIAGTHPKNTAELARQQDLTSEQAKQANALAAALNARRLADAPLTEQAEVYADALERQVRGAKERLGLLGVDPASLASIGTANGLFELGNSLRGTAKLKALEEATALALVEDKQRAINKAIQDGNALVVKNFQDRIADATKRQADAAAILARGDRSTPEADAAFTRAGADQSAAFNDARQAEAALKAFLVTNIPALKSAYESITAALAAAGKDVSDAGLLARRQLEASRKALEAIPAVQNNPFIPSTVAAGLALGGGARPGPGNDPNAPVDYSGTGYGPSAAGARFPAPDSGDTGPLSDANFEETARSRVPAADDLAKAADGVADAINTKLTPAGDKLTAAADALPGQLAPIVDGLGSLLDTQAEHFDALAGLVQTQQGVTEGIGARLAQLTTRVNNYIASQG